MSHISTLQTQINDLDALEEACHELGLELRREQKTYSTYSRTARACDAAIVLPGNVHAYEIGVIAVGGGAYTLNYDEWNEGHGMVAKVGHDCGRLMHEYGRAKTKRIAQANGWRYREEKLADGRVRFFCQPKPQFAQAGQGKRW